MSNKSAIQAELEKTLDHAVKDGKIPCAAVYATNTDGSFEYSYQTGQGIKEGVEPVFMLASQTKLMTSIAALQAVEQGFFTLDEDVSGLIPEVSKNGILTGFDDAEKPILEERKNPITLRQLITHSSGATYPTFHPNIIKHQAQRGFEPFKQANAPTIEERFDSAMVFQPGESWMYSPGLDWIGVLIKRKTNGEHDLESWMRKYIWTALGIGKDDITFWPEKEMKEKIPPLKVRDKEGKLVPNTDDTINTLSTECFGGHGSYAKLSSYLKILRSILANDGKLVKPETVEQMFTPQLGAGSKAAFNGFLQMAKDMLPGDFNLEIESDYGLGGMIFLQDDEGRRKKGTLSWSGLFNCFWIIDRESGIAYTFGTQVLPPGEKGCKEMEGVAERAVYKMAGVF